MSAETERDVLAYNLATEFLMGFSQVNEEMLERHLNAFERPSNLSGVYRKLVIHAQNRQMLPRVIGDAIGGVDNLHLILCEFEPANVTEKYGADFNRLLDDIVKDLRPRGEIRRTSRSLWPMFCKSILSGARLLSGFGEAARFYDWVEGYYADENRRPELPGLLSQRQSKQKIFGFGFALACDFLKEIGYVGFGKPDVHLREAFLALDLCSSADDLVVHHAIARVARAVGSTAYRVDKLFWLIGSGRFYLDEVEIGKHRSEFIEFARAKMKATLAELAASS